MRTISMVIGIVNKHHLVNVSDKAEDLECKWCLLILLRPVLIVAALLYTLKLYETGITMNNITSIFWSCTNLHSLVIMIVFIHLPDITLWGKYLGHSYWLLKANNCSVVQFLVLKHDKILSTTYNNKKQRACWQILRKQLHLSYITKCCMKKFVVVMLELFLQ